MQTKRFTRQALEEHYENDRFHTTEIYSINEECVTYSAVMDTDDGKHYAVQYYVPHKPGKIRFQQVTTQKCTPTRCLTYEWDTVSKRTR